MKKEINGKAKIIGIIGKNIENSLSPLIHNQIILKHSLNFCYLPFQVEDTNLAIAIQGTKALNIRGVNITFPYKVKVIKFLEEGIEEIYIFNRTSGKAEKIKKDFSSFFPKSSIHVFPLEEEDMKGKIEKAHLLVNTTSLGITPQSDNTLLPDKKLFHPNLLVYDLIYHPAKTLFLRQAERAGA